MNRRDAREIAKTVTNEQLKQMFEKAATLITDWKRISNVNKGITKGAAWNILAKDFDTRVTHHILAKTNMIREFGEFLPDSLKPCKVKRDISNNRVVHQDPQF